MPFSQSPSIPPLDPITLKNEISTTIPGSYNYSSVPQIEMFNQTTTVYAAAIVGGGSAVDHMMFDRGSAGDYDNWEKLGNPGWGWSDLFPYFEKVCHRSMCWNKRYRPNSERQFHNSNFRSTGRLRIHI